MYHCCFIFGILYRRSATIQLYFQRFLRYYLTPRSLQILRSELYCIKSSIECYNCRANSYSTTNSISNSEKQYVCICRPGEAKRFVPPTSTRTIATSFRNPTQQYNRKTYQLEAKKKGSNHRKAFLVISFPLAIVLIRLETNIEVGRNIVEH